MPELWRADADIEGGAGTGAARGHDRIFWVGGIGAGDVDLRGRDAPA